MAERGSGASGEPRARYEEPVSGIIRAGFVGVVASVRRHRALDGESGRRRASGAARVSTGGLHGPDVPLAVNVLVRSSSARAWARNRARHAEPGDAGFAQRSASTGDRLRAFDLGGLDVGGRGHYSDEVDGSRSPRNAQGGGDGRLDGGDDSICYLAVGSGEAEEVELGALTRFRTLGGRTSSSAG